MVAVDLYNLAHDLGVFERLWEFVPERWTRATKKQAHHLQISLLGLNNVDVMVKCGVRVWSEGLGRMTVPKYER